MLNGFFLRDLDDGNNPRKDGNEEAAREAFNGGVSGPQRLSDLRNSPDGYGVGRVSCSRR
jgi:hypothetical protein